jgi:hypothetical protein
VLVGSKFVGVVASNKSKTDWKMSGAYRLLDTATSTVPMGFMCVNGILVLCSTRASGKATDATVSFKLSETMRCKVEFETKFIPDTIHPVFWVDSANGVNGNSGWNPSVAAKDFGYMVAADRVPYGACVQLIQPDTVFDGSTVVWKSNSVNATIQGDITEPVTIRGYGATKTKIRYSAAGAATTIFSISGGNKMRARFADLTVYSDKSARLFDASQTAGQSNELEFVRCVVGDSTKPVSGVVRCNTAPVRLFSTIVQPSKDSHCFTTNATAAEPCNFTLDGSIVLSCLNSFEITNTSTTNQIRMYNTKLYNYSGSGVNISGAGAASVFAGWGNEFSTTFPLASGAVTGGGTFAQKMQDTTVRGAVNNATAFADNCKLGLYAKYDYKYSDYVD